MDSKLSEEKEKAVLSIDLKQYVFSSRAEFF